jgi:hypothetical protein
MAKLHFSRFEIGALCERMESRGTSVVLRDRPELCRDLLCGAALLRFMLNQGVPVSSCEVEVIDGLG